MLYKGDTLYLDWLEDGIAELVFDAPGSVNKLDTATVASLGEAIGVLEQQSDLKGLLLRSNKAAFIVGADITEFLSLFLVPEEQLSQWLHFANSVFNRLEDLPVLMKAGAIVPMRDSRLRDNSLKNPGAMEVRIFPAADGAFTLWEDAGDTPEDLEENWAYTNFSVTAGEKGCFVVEGARGNLSVLPPTRSWRLVFVGTGCATPRVYVKGFPAPCQSFYEAETESLVVEIPRVPVEAEIRAEFPEGLFPAEGAVEERCYRILDKSRIAYDLKQALYEAIEKSGRNALGAVLAYEPEESVLGQLAEILTSRNA